MTGYLTSQLRAQHTRNQRTTPQGREEAVKKLGTVPSAPSQKPDYQHLSRARVDCPRFVHSFEDSKPRSTRPSNSLPLSLGAFASLRRIHVIANFMLPG